MGENSFEPSPVAKRCSMNDRSEFQSPAFFVPGLGM